MKHIILDVVKRIAILLIFIVVFASPNVYSQLISPPKQHFGFEPGTDGMLFDYEEMIDYFKTLEKESPRVKSFVIGETPMGKPLYMVCISSEENIKNLDNLKKINEQLALDYSLKRPEVDNLKKDGRVFVLGTLTMHSTEVAPAQAAPVIAYRLAKATGKDTLSWLNNVVYMMVPSHNPDGMNMVNHNYMENKGTKFEATNLPGVYHKYVGHNINRDFIHLTQPENKAISALTSSHWFPQVMVEKHQMGSTGARYFVPPNHDPIAQNVDESLWSWIGLFGANMLKDMTAHGQKGIAQRYIFDNYWPGSTETCLWKNVVSFLTEAASVKTATPIYIEKNELKVWGKGISEYKKGANFTAPWEGGWWRLSDIVAYELSSTFSMIKTASLHRESILQHRNDIAVREYNKGLNEPPYYYVFPKNQNNKSEMARLVSLLHEHGVVVHHLKKDVTVKNTIYKEGDVVVTLAQPFRAFIKEVLEIQEYPERRYMPGGEIIKPYDVTSWSLPLTMGLNVTEVDTKSPELEASLTVADANLYSKTESESKKHMVFHAGSNESYKVAFKALASGVEVHRLANDIELAGETFPKGSFVLAQDAQELIEGLDLQVAPVYANSIETSQLWQINMPRIAIVDSWFHDMDAGWTRYLFDTYNIPYKILRPGSIAEEKLQKNYDVIIFPNQDHELIQAGKRKRQNEQYPMNLPPEFAKGMGSKGKENVLKFVNEGGKVIAWGRSVEHFMGMLAFEKGKDDKEEFVLPVKNVVKSLQSSGFEATGAHANVDVLPNHPITLGYNSALPIFFNSDAVFETSIPYFDTDRRVILSFPEKNQRLSGYMKKGELLENKAALVWVKKNKGQLILFGFNPQYRGQTSGTFGLIFNSLLMK